MYAPKNNGMGNIFTAGLRRAMYALQSSPTRETVKTTIANLPGLNNWYNQMRTAADETQRREGQTSYVLDLQGSLNTFRDVLSRFDDAVRRAVEEARADGNVITTRDNTSAGLGVLPVIVVVGLTALAVVSAYTVVTQFGAAARTAIDDAFSLQQMRAQLEAMVAAHATPSDISRLNSNLHPDGSGGAPQTGGGGPAGWTTFLQGAFFPVLIGAGALWFFSRKSKS